MKKSFFNNSYLIAGLISFFFLTCSTKPNVKNDNPVGQRPTQSLEVPKILKRPNAKDFKDPRFNVGDEVVAYEMSWQKREPKQIARRMEGALHIFLGKKNLSQLPKEESLDSVIKGEKAGKWVRIDSSPFVIKYEQEYDEIRIIHEEREAMFRPSKDIGEAAIQKIAETYLKQLGESGVVDSRLYTNAVMQLGYKIIGEGSTDDKEILPGKIAEYRITYRPKLNGIEMANTGLRLGILVSGELANLRFGGVTPKGKWKGNVLEPEKKEHIRKIRINTNELMSRFYNNKLKAGDVQVAYSKVMYVMPNDNRSEEIVEPKLVISYTDQREMDKQTVVSRRKTIAYSLTDPQAPFIDYDAPVVRHEETQPTRKR